MDDRNKRPKFGVNDQVRVVYPTSPYDRFSARVTGVVPMQSIDGLRVIYLYNVEFDNLVRMVLDEDHLEFE